MKAIRVHRFGGPEVLTYEEIPRPIPAPDEVVVRIEAAGVGPWDAWIRSGRSALPQPLPLTLGSDLAGIVEEVGESVRGLHAGEEVYGVTNPQFTGAYAQWAVASAAMVSSKPRSLDFIQAASVPVVAVTAWQMLFDHARIRPGQRVLVLGSSGSVGSLAVQLAHRHRAHVIATISFDDAQRLRDLGADEIVDLRNAEQTQALAPVDAVIDTAGGEIQRFGIGKLKGRGFIISSVSAPDPVMMKEQGVEGEFFLVRTTADYLQKIGNLIDGGELSIRVGVVLPLSQAREAHEMLDGLRSYPRGKIVLTT
jgi:NADPH:quinone reductase-like Zn-dependent oxidoreductase